MACRRDPTSSFAPRLALATLSLVALGGCKEAPTCDPGSVKWGVRLAFGASPTINLAEDGSSLPTTVRVYQLRGETAVDDLDFDTLWQADEPDELGDAFLSKEELTIYPDRPGFRSLPIETDATHILAAGLFRQPLGNTWYTVYEIPQRHPEVVCAKAPATKTYPDPCFYVYLDRASLSGGPAAPAGFIPDDSIQCAALGVVPDANAGNKKRRRRRKPPDLEDPLNTKGVDSKIPKTPETPQPSLPEAPSLPDKPRAPTVPKPKG